MGKEILHFIVEIILIFFAVLIFRSLWLIFDRFEYFNKINVLVVMLIVGIVGTILCLHYLFGHEKEHKK
ncbi:MAG: hypothetical protein QW727_02990 [Candidatus Pacearchaeota archaeon]